MIKLNETSSVTINVLGEEELTQVVGGSCHRRRGYGHCGGYRRRDRDNYGHCGGYEKSESYDSYEGGDDSSASSNNVQIADVNVTVNIAQVQG
jgi:hypothetical protein